MYGERRRRKHFSDKIHSHHFIIGGNPLYFQCVVMLFRTHAIYKIKGVANIIYLVKGLAGF